MAEVKDSVSSIKVGMEEMKKEIQQGFGSLRRDLTPQRQQYAPRQNYVPQHQYTPAFQDQRQPYRQPAPGQPGVIQSPTQGSGYVNNTLRGARRPAAPYANQFQSGPRGQYNQQSQNLATIGAMEETMPKTETPASATFIDTEAMGNMGHGWQAFPGADQPEGYDAEPLGIHAFNDESFQQPAASPQGPPLA